MTKTKLSRRRVWKTALTMSSVFAWSGTFAVAQEAPADGPAPIRASARNQSGASGASLPSSLQPVMDRVFAMLQAARTHAKTAATEARPSYRNAQSIFAELSSSASGASRQQENPSEVVVTSEQTVQDIRALRAAAQDAAQAGQRTRLNRMAEQYAAGTKEFFTAQLREALFAPTSLPPVKINNEGNAPRPRQAPAAPPAPRPSENPTPPATPPTLPPGIPPTPPADPTAPAPGMPPGAPPAPAPEAPQTPPGEAVPAPASPTAPGK